MQDRSVRLLDDGTAEVDCELIAVDGVRLEGILGVGANGVVFSGTQVLLNRPVAVKVWPPRQDRRRSQSQRTRQALQEVVKLATLNDNSIVRVHTAGFMPNQWVYVIIEKVEKVESHSRTSVGMNSSATSQHECRSAAAWRSL